MKILKINNSYDKTFGKVKVYEPMSDDQTRVAANILKLMRTSYNQNNESVLEYYDKKGFDVDIFRKRANSSSDEESVNVIVHKRKNKKNYFIDIGNYNNDNYANVINDLNSKVNQYNKNKFSIKPSVVYPMLFVCAAVGYLCTKRIKNKRIIKMK